MTFSRETVKSGGSSGASAGGGTQTRTSPPSGKLIDHYVLMESGDQAATYVDACADFIGKFELEAGFSVSLAKQAGKVTVVGNVSGGHVAQIKGSGAQVEELKSSPGAVKIKLAGRVKSGKAFG